MASSSVEFQQAVFTLLKADAAVAAAVGTRIYDGAPASAAYPYITFGPSNSVPDDANCVNGVTETLQIDILASDQAKVWPCKDIVAAVRRALHEADISLTTHACAGCRVVTARVEREADWVTAHGFVVVQGMLEEV